MMITHVIFVLFPSIFILDSDQYLYCTRLGFQIVREFSIASVLTDLHCKVGFDCDSKN